MVSLDAYPMTMVVRSKIPRAILTEVEIVYTTDIYKFVLLTNFQYIFDYCVELRVVYAECCHKGDMNIQKNALKPLFPI